MAEVVAILTRDDVLETKRIYQKMKGRDDWKGLARSDYEVTFERDGKRYQCRMCDCDLVEMQAFQEAWMRILGEMQSPSFWEDR
jgi:hypothetical protein